MSRVYSDTLQMAFSANYSIEEIAYIIKMMIQFSTWSITVTNQDYIDELLRQLHGLWKSIPSKYFKTYIGLCSYRPRYDKVLIAVMRSPFYRELNDYRNLETVKRLREKVWKLRSKIRR